MLARLVLLSVLMSWPTSAKTAALIELRLVLLETNNAPAVMPVRAGKSRAVRFVEIIVMSEPTVARLVTDRVVNAQPVKSNMPPTEVSEFAVKEEIPLLVILMSAPTVVSAGSDSTNPPENSKLMLATVARLVRVTDVRAPANRQNRSPEIDAREPAEIVVIDGLFRPSKSPTTVVNRGADIVTRAGQSPKNNPVEELAVNAGRLTEVKTVFWLVAKIVHVFSDVVTRLVRTGIVLTTKNPVQVCNLGTDTVVIAD